MQSALHPLPIACLLLAGLSTGCQTPLHRGLERYEEGDYERALALWQPLAEQGQPEAQYLVGLLHEEGRGVEQDPREAARWYRLAATGGNAAAQSNLGRLHYRGEGVSRSYEEAAQWYECAAARGFAVAQSNLAVMYLLGQGVAYDPEHARELLHRASDQGFERARWILEAIDGRKTTSASIDPAYGLQHE